MAIFRTSELSDTAKTEFIELIGSVAGSVDLFIDSLKNTSKSPLYEGAIFYNASGVVEMLQALNGNLIDQNVIRDRLLKCSREIDHWISEDELGLLFTQVTVMAVYGQNLQSHT